LGNAFLEQPLKFTCACQVARFARVLIYSMMFAERLLTFSGRLTSDNYDNNVHHEHQGKHIRYAKPGKKEYDVNYHNVWRNVG
jgi:hypothetical protein